MIRIEQFISEKVTKRPESMFQPDIVTNYDILSSYTKVRNKTFG